MKARNLIAAAVAALSLGLPHAVLASSDHHGHHDSQKLTLDKGRKWATDEALRNGMEDIRGALAVYLEPVRGKDSPVRHQALGETLEYHVAKIVATCKLEPAADANFHIIVADLVAAADGLQGKGSETPKKAARKAVRALEAYAKYFDHPGFQPVRLAAR